MRSTHRKFQLLCVTLIGAVGMVSTPAESRAAPTAMVCYRCWPWCPTNVESFCADIGCPTDYATCGMAQDCLSQGTGRYLINCNAMSFSVD